MVCAPPTDIGIKIIEAIDELHLAADHNTLAILMDVATVPSWRSVSFVHEDQNVSLELNITNLVATISSVTKQYVLMYSDSDSTSDCCETDVERNINRTLAILFNEFVEIVEFFLLDLSDGDNWRQLARVTKDLNGVSLEVLFDNMDEWSMKHAHKDECEGCDSEYEKTLNVLMTLGYSAVLVSIVIAIVAVARKQLLKKRVAKGPYKVVLTATDFVFPQIADSRRVS